MVRTGRLLTLMTLLLSVCSAAKPLVAQAYTPPTSAQVEALVKQLLQGQNSYGYDPNYAGILINWRRDDPTQVNCGGANVCDTQPNSTRHDSINDIRDLQHLYWYSQRNPGDTSFNSAITSVVTTTKSEWGTTSLNKGWVYGILVRLYEYAPTAAERAYWQNVIVKYWAPVNYKNLDPTLHVQINYNTGNCDCGSKTIYLAQSFRIPYAVEIGADLVDAGVRFGHPEWTAAGYQSVQYLASHVFVAKYGLTGRIFLVSDPKYSGTNYVWDTQSQPQDVSEMAEALVRAAAIVKTSAAISNGAAITSDLNALAAQQLDALNTVGTLHDKVNGGYFETFYVGPNFDGTAEGTTVTAYKEGRQLSLVGTAHLYDLLNNSTRYSSMEAEMLRVATQPNTPAVAGVDGMLLPNTVSGTPPTVNGQPANTSGYTFQVYANYGLYYASGVYENWVSAEQNNLSMLGLQEWLSTAAGTTTVLSASSLGLTLGGTETLTATVQGSNGTSATGTVLFYDGASLLGGGLLDATGKAQFSVSSLTAGTHSLTAQFQGDTDFYAASGSSSVSVVVGGLTTSTSLNAAPNAITQGSQVTFVANVNGTGTPTGAVTFLDGGVAIGAGTLSSKVASFSTSALTVGTHNITATYGGDTTFASSTSAAVSVVVTGSPTATQTTLVASPPSVTVGTAVNISVSVGNISNGYGTATGSVTLLDGGAAVATATLVAGAASFSVSSLSVGTHSLTAQYGSDSSHNASTSTSVQMVVTSLPVNTAAGLTASTPTVQAGAALTLLATISSPANGVATGTVDFFDGANVIGSEPLGAAGTASLTITTLGTGIHTLSAEYEGDATHNGSVSAGITVTVTPTPVSTTTTLSASATNLAVGATVVMSVSVSSSANGAPGGVVSLMDGSLPVGSATLDATGAATFSLSTLTVGSHTFSASYAGDPTHNTSSSATVTVVVGAPGFMLSAAPAQMTATAGAEASTVITMTPLFGFAQTATLSVSGLPAYANARFSSTTLTPGTAAVTATLYVAIDGQTASTRTPATMQGRTQLALIAGGLLLCCLRRRRCRSVCTLAGCVVLLGGLSGCGSGTSSTGGSQPPPHVTAPGSYTLTVTATTAAQTQTTTVTLVVQ